MVAEKYDEVVFTNPKVDFHKSLMQNKAKKLPYPLSNEQSVLEHFRTYGDEEDVKTMLAAKKFLENELRNVKDRLIRVDAELDEVKHSLAVTKDMEMMGTSAGAISGLGENTAAGVGAHSGGSNTKGGGSGKGRKSKKKATATSSESQPAGKKAKAS